MEKPMQKNAVENHHHDSGPDTWRINSVGRIMNQGKVKKETRIWKHPEDLDGNLTQRIRRTYPGLEEVQRNLQRQLNKCKELHVVGPPRDIRIAFVPGTRQSPAPGAPPLLKYRRVGQGACLKDKPPWTKMKIGEGGQIAEEQNAPVFAAGLETGVAGAPEG
ncbi:hypothetical protein CJ030_MR6G007064 [Morella rubra]|uniref:Uncharacterized protein n=1 Tax=Morella rubra TaxID=262757 RepID=A0A6A1V7K4_9ROSI|nr:hypothetical protein CJ030_MR6G007064 [Morella rubra]